MRPKGSVAQWKTEEVDKLAHAINAHPVIGLVDMTSFPSKQLVSMKRLLKGKALIKMSKKSLITRAIEKSGRKEILEFVGGQPALLLTKENPFEIAKILDENKAKAGAKPNSLMPIDIVVPAGETSFPPGPIVGELQKAGIKAAIERGKVVVKEDSTIAKAGERVNAKQAEAMNKLGIEPVELKLRLLAAWENKFVFSEAALGITKAQVMSWIKSGSTSTFNFTCKIGYPTPQNIRFFVQKAFTNTKGVALKANYACEATVKELLARANAQAKSLEAKVPAQPAAAEEKK